MERPNSDRQFVVLAGSAHSLALGHTRIQFSHVMHQFPARRGRMSARTRLIAGLLALALAAGSGPARAADDPTADLVAANRILVERGVLDAFGHVSARSMRDPQHMLLARALAPSLVTSADLMVFDIRTCAPVGGDARPAYTERFIHCAIYRRNPAVRAVVHSHAPALIPFGVAGTALRPAYHMAGFMRDAAPVFEIEAVRGPVTDMLVRDAGLGDALARTLGDHPLALMRGHGAVIVADSLRKAVFRSVYAEANARVVAEASRLGPVRFLGPEEARSAAANEPQLADRAWALWTKDLGGP